ncbi:CARDB domain-containing protein [Sulfitobacter sediminilitoris]
MLLELRRHQRRFGRPGGRIASVFSGDDYFGEYTYVYLDGTSMAAPHVMGALALLSSEYPDLSPAQLRETLLARAAPTTSLDGITVTGARLDVGAMVEDGSVSVLAEPQGAPQIYIESKPVPWGFGAVHLYLVYRDAYGVEWNTRSGPEGNIFNFGDLILEVNEPLEDSSDARGNLTPEERNSTLLDLGALTADEAWARIVKYGWDLHDRAFNYDLDGINSNATIGALLEAIGLDPDTNLPTGITDTQAVGFDSYPDMVADVAPPTDGIFRGTEGADVFTGIQIDEVIWGLGGADEIYGGDSSDPYNNGRTGNDTILGGSGNDTIFGGDGDDEITGGEGDDDVDGQTGDDTFIDGLGSDTYIGGQGTDTVRFALAQSAYAFSLNTSGALLVQAGGETDTVDATVESFAFLDGVADFDGLLNPDLSAGNVAASDTSPTVNDTITVTYDITNTGNAAAVDTTAGIYLSTDNIITSSDTLLGTEVSTASNLAGAVDSESVSVVLPELAAGTYYIGVIADVDNDETGESDETNNASPAPVEITLQPDLSVNVQRVDGTSYVSPNGMREGTTISRGVDMAGAIVTATYTDGTSETLTWQALDPYTFGGATGTEIDMSFGFESHQLTTTKRLASFEIDLQPSASVWDTTAADETQDPLAASTPGTSYGFPFEFVSGEGPLAGTVGVTYSDIVNLDGRPADGDLYATMLVDFTGLDGGGLLGTVEWNSDMDPLSVAGDLVPAVDFDLVLGALETGSYGRNFNGTSDSDGLIRAGFTGTTEDLVLSLTGYDMDDPREVEILLNGVGLGYLGMTGDNGTGTFQFDILASDQQVGDNVIEFRNINPNYTWGITELLLEPGVAVDFDLVLGALETGSYGRNFNGTSDSDGLIRAGFTGTTEDLVLSLTGYDMDDPREVEILLNGVGLGYLGMTGDNGTGTFQFDILASDQQVGDNVIEFRNINPNYTWGITELLLEPGVAVDFDLVLGALETGSYGRNFNGTSDSDGLIRAGFTGTTEDLVLSLTGYDMDDPREVEILLNGVGLGYLGMTGDNGTGTFQFDILASDQQVGDNVIEFRNINPNYTWGITELLLEPGVAVDFDLVLGALETGSYGRNFNGTSDSDGLIRAGFTGTTEDLVLSLTGYDMDDPREVEILLNGVGLGYLGMTGDNGTGTFQFDILASDQQVGDNVIEFRNINPNYTWGLRNYCLNRV